MLRWPCGHRGRWLKATGPRLCTSMSEQMSSSARPFKPSSRGRLGAHALPSMNPDEEIWAKTGHPFAPTSLAMAVGDEQSTWSDYGMRWDNSGKNAHYA